MTEKLEAEIELLKRSNIGLIAEQNSLRKRLADLESGIKILRRYCLVEGYAKSWDDKKSIGFAFDGSIWGFAADPDYQAFEALEKCEKWFHERLDKLLGAEVPQKDVTDHDRTNKIDGADCV